jgi:hypothetical protein
LQQHWQRLHECDHRQQFRRGHCGASLTMCDVELVIIEKQGVLA